MPQIRRTRASLPKVKTGCTTCKVRRVKCDETKPECLRCKKSGWKCETSDSQSQRQQALFKRKRAYDRRITICSDHRIILRPGTREERLYVELFCNQISHSVSGLFTSDLWEYLLPQLSHSEPAVRHAMAAVAAVHQRFVHNGRQDQSAMDDPFVLQQYNKAIQQLIEDRSGQGPNQDITLVTCCLFICLEILRGNNPEALNHLESGLKILCGQAKACASDSGNKPISKRTEVEEDLSHLFSRLNIQMSLWSRPLAPFEPGNVMDSKDLLQRFVMFSTIEEARHALNNIMGKALGFVRSVQNKSGGLQETMMAKKAVHRRVFDDWLIAFENMMNQPRKYIKTLDPRGPLILRIHHRVALIWLETCPLFDVMSFDNYWDDFEDIVSFASEVIAYNSKVNDSSNKFCLDMEIFPPVYYAAINCRHPLLRRRAIEILSTYHRQECLWEPRERTKVAELVLRIEETRLASLPVEQRIPEARDRVYEPLSSEERVLNPSRITLLFKPNGPNEDWHSETHFVHW